MTAGFDGNPFELFACICFSLAAILVGYAVIRRK